MILRKTDKPPVRRYQLDVFSGWRLVAATSLLIILWSLVLAVGVLLQPQCNLSRILLTIFVPAIFVGLWIVLVFARSR